MTKPPVPNSPAGKADKTPDEIAEAIVMKVTKYLSGPQRVILRTLTQNDIAEALTDARREALEEAARVAREERKCWMGAGGQSANTIARADGAKTAALNIEREIDALKSQPAKGGGV